MERAYEAGETLAGTPYRVARHIATGGMGSVYEVVDVSLGKRYALKALRGSMLKDAAIAHRMREEAKMLGRLTHPNVVQVFTAGVTQDEHRIPYFVMELLIGSTLRDLLRVRGALDLQTATAITLELLGALEQAHELDLVHRDIKPDNVFLHRMKRHVRTTKLLDFGVADLVASANTDPSTFFGTFRYASPEQLRGLPISHATDLYGVGLLLYEMLTGAHPFARAASRDAMTQAHLYETPEIPADWPPAVRALLRSALAKDAADRPRDAWTFAARLRKAMGAAGIVPRQIETDDVVVPTVDAHAPTRVLADPTERDCTIEVSRQELVSRSAVTRVEKVT